ncbi:MAG TPA: PEP-CTERM sorting domain-containing protein [Nitrospirota bacterium]
MKHIFLVLAVLLLPVPGVHAALMTSAPAGTTYELTTISGNWANAPSVVAGGFSVDATPGNNVWYGDSFYNFASNGYWSSFAWVGGDCWYGDCTATIDLDGAYSSVGGFMNYSTSGVNPYENNPIITAIGADGATILESYDLSMAPIITPAGINDGAFRGISRDTADIWFFRISGSYLAMHDLTLASASVPEPATLSLAGMGFAALALLRRRISK